MRAEAGAAAAPRDRAYYEERRRARERAARIRRRLLAGAVVAVVALVLGVGVGFAGSSDRIAGGVKIAGIDVGGMTAAEAKRALERRAAEAAAEPVVFTHGGQSFAIEPAALGVSTDWEKAIEEALDAGDGFVLFRGFRRLELRFSGADVGPAGAADPAKVDRQVSRLASTIDQQPREAAIVLEGLRPVVQPAQVGVELSRVEAGKVLVAALAGFERGKPVALPVRTSEPEVTAPDLAPLAAQVRTALSAPVRLTRASTRLTVAPEQLATFLVLPENGSRELAIGGKAAERYFAGVARALERKPKDAGFRLTSAGRVKVVPAREGRELDVDATTKVLLAAALASSPTERNAGLVVVTAQPKLTTAAARGMGIAGVVSSYTTFYGGEANRIHNVQLVSKLIDDHLIPPGGIFSFNKTTGERNADKGFLEAPVIINGELQTGLGGGVCQVSTTVFNAAYDAGLPILERTNHALYISHYPLGRDATVNYPDTDLRFRNDTGHWLWLRAFVDASSLTINLYGTPLHRKVVTDTSPLRVTGPPKLKKIKDPALLKGERVVEESGTPSRAVSVRRIVYDENGEVLYDATWYSSYRSEPRVVRIGTKKGPKPAEETPSSSGSQGGAVPGAGAGAGGGAGSPPPTEEPPSDPGSSEPPPPPA